jgi:hypothetical protein
MARCFQIHRGDNVATLLEDCGVEMLDVIGQSPSCLPAREKISLGHKVALRPIPPGGEIVKYGVRIGLASAAIDAGAWVHLHNCRSAYDERSASFDVMDGSAKDTHYE